MPRRTRGASKGEPPSSDICNNVLFLCLPCNMLLALCFVKVPGGRQRSAPTPRDGHGGGRERLRRGGPRGRLRGSHPTATFVITCFFCACRAKLCWRALGFVKVPGSRSSGSHSALGVGCSWQGSRMRGLCVWCCNAWQVGPGGCSCRWVEVHIQGPRRAF